MRTIPHRPGNPFGVLTAYEVVPAAALFTITQVFDDRYDVTDIHLDPDCTILCDFREDVTATRVKTITAGDLAIANDVCPACSDSYSDVLAGLTPPTRLTEADAVIVAWSSALFQISGKPGVEAASANMALVGAARALREATVTRDLGRDIVAACHDRAARVQGTPDWARHLLRAWTGQWRSNRVPWSRTAVLTDHGHRDPFADGGCQRLVEIARDAGTEDLQRTMAELRRHTAWVVPDDGDLDRDLAIAGSADRGHPLLLRVPVAALFGGQSWCLDRARIAHPDGDVPADVVAAAYAVWETRRDTDLPALVDAMRVAADGD